MWTETSAYLFALVSPDLFLTLKNLSNFFDIYLSEKSSYSVTSKKTDETVQMVCKVNSIFHTSSRRLKKSGFTDFVKELL